MITLETAHTKAQILQKGAELSSLWDKRSHTEYIWQADPAFWDRHSPVLFPIVGTLKDGKYRFEGKDYPLARHGFARDSQFEVAAQKSNCVTLVLKSCAESLVVYPFHFVLKIRYTLTEEGLSVEYEVGLAEKESSSYTAEYFLKE